MRWDRFFEDLEDQADSEWEAERLALDTEAERLRLSRVTLRERLAALDPAGETPSIELRDGTVVRGAVAAVGADWLGVAAASARPGLLVVPLGGILAVGLPHPELLRTARAETSDRRRALADRMGLGFVLRDAARRRIAVTVRLDGERTLSGTIDRAGADHLDLALHEPGSPRRAEGVVGFRVVPFAAIVWLRLESTGYAVP